MYEMQVGLVANLRPFPIGLADTERYDKSLVQANDGRELLSSILICES